MNPQWPLFLFWLVTGSGWIASGEPIIGSLWLTVAAGLGFRLQTAMKADRELRR